MTDPVPDLDLHILVKRMVLQSRPEGLGQRLPVCAGVHEQTFANAPCGSVWLMTARNLRVVDDDECCFSEVGIGNRIIPCQWSKESHS